MTDRWHLTPQSGDVKGNNPYQLNRMTIDPIFRATSGYHLNNIHGYSAMGEVILKGERLSLGPPKEKSYLDPMKKPVGDLVPANQRSLITKSDPITVETTNKQGRKMSRKNKVARLNALLQQQQPQTNPGLAGINDKIDAREPAGVLMNREVTDWQQSFGHGHEPSQSHLSQLTKSRYTAIMGEKKYF